MTARYSGSRVLVTGHTGFKGAWLSEWLLRMGAHVAGYALAPPSDPSLFDALDLDRRMDHEIGDVTDLHSLSRRVREVRPEIVFHLAAQALVIPSFADPLGTFETNVMGTLNLLQALVDQTNPCVVVVVTSDKCYRPTMPPRRHAEEDALGGNDPYSASKASAELVVASWRESFFPVVDYARHGTLISTARAGNVIGGGDWAVNRIVPDIIRAVADGRSVELRNPGATRPWQHVLDALSGYLLLGATHLAGDDPALTGAYNFGPESLDAMSVGELTARVLQAWGHGDSTSHARPTETPETHHLALSVDKAMLKLGWAPVYDTADAIEETVLWYQAHYRGADMIEVTGMQLDAFEARAAASNDGHFIEKVR